MRSRARPEPRPPRGGHRERTHVAVAGAELAEDVAASALVAQPGQRDARVPGERIAAQAEQPAERPPLQPGLRRGEPELAAQLDGRSLVLAIARADLGAGDLHEDAARDRIRSRPHRGRR